MSSYNRNPTGNNQYGDIPKADDPVLSEALTRYHREGKSSNEQIQRLYETETGKRISISTIKRRRSQLGLIGSRSKKSNLTDKRKEQIILDQMDKDQAKGQGVRTMKARIAFDQGIHIPREEVSRIMHLHDPEGFEYRDPSAKRIHREPVVAIGIHERWSGDGHDKLYSIGYPVWAVVDFATSKILGAWVVPSNRLGSTIGYLFLCLVERYKGLPIEFSSDCGSETTALYGYANALRENFHSDISITEVPAHRYLRSVHNIVIERSWLRLRLEFGDNAVKAFKRGEAEGLYNPNDPEQLELSRWLWPKVLRQELDKYVVFRNGYKSRKDSTKVGPSGCSRNDAFTLHDDYGLRNCLLPLDERQLDIVHEIKQEMEGLRPLAFVSDDFDERAQAAYLKLGVTELTFDNAWHVFLALLPQL